MSQFNFTIPDFEGLKEQVAIEVRNRCAARTPVKTGKARDGWQVNPEEGRIWNDVRYIQCLEHGSPTTSASNMATLTMEEADNIIAQKLPHIGRVKV